MVERLSTYTHSFPLDDNINKEMEIDIKEISRNAMSILKDIMKAESEELKKENYGVELLHTIGYIYRNKAEQALAQYDVDNGAIHRKLFGYTTKFTGLMRESMLSPEDQERKVQLEFEAANKGMETVWRGSKLEIESVLREVCDNVLFDTSVSSELRRRRADALLAIGEVFSAVKPDPDSTTTNFPVTTN
jgi:hypothetical protein